MNSPTYLVEEFIDGANIHTFGTNAQLLKNAIKIVFCGWVISLVHIFLLIVLKESKSY